MSESGVHYVLGTSFLPPFPTDTEYVILGTGCFWGAEKSFWRMPGVYSTAVGYCGAAAGKHLDAGYEEVCRGRTGHTEAVLVVWHPKQLTFADIVRMFLQCHDPTQVNGQGNDHGTQYRSALYYHTEDQKRIAEAAIRSFERSLAANGKKRKIATEVKEKSLDDFVFAEDYHQQYLSKPGARPYCSAQPQGVDMDEAANWLPTDLGKKYAAKLNAAFWEKHAPTPHCVLKQPHEPIQWPEGEKDE